MLIEKLDSTMLLVALLMLVSAGALKLKYRDQDSTVFIPLAAWLRACTYFCFCLIVAWQSGALLAALKQPWVTPEQLGDPMWYLWTSVTVIFIFWAYCIYWAGHTIRFDRKLDLLPQSLFGLIWGITSGLYFLALWHVSLGVADYFGGWPTWAVWLLAYTLISLWQMLWMDMYWDVWVSPEHDSPESIRKKVPRTHIPNMTLCLSYFALYENYLIFIGLQTIALLAASIGIRMPAPWSSHSTPPARQVPGLFGLPRAGGYLSDDPADDPYLKAANLSQ